jgi:plastocyanin
VRLTPTSRVRKPRSMIASLSIVSVALLALAGCGSGKSSTPTAPASSSTSTSISASSTQAPASSRSSGAQDLALAANPEGQLSYNTKTLTAKPGKVTIDFTNMSPLMHNMNVESSSGHTLGSTPTFQGSTKSVTLDLTAGTYKFFCSVPGHRQAGMEGTLVVR